MQGLLDVIIRPCCDFQNPWAQVKRVYILGDGKVALVETPVEGYELPQDDAPLHDRLDSRCACIASPCTLLTCTAVLAALRCETMSACLLGRATDGCCAAAVCVHKPARQMWATGECAL